MTGTNYYPPNTMHIPGPPPSTSRTPPSFSRTRPFTVIILGSNLPALTLALTLSRQKVAFTLLAPSPLLITDDRMVGLHPHGVAILDQLGVWEQLQEHAIVARGGWWDMAASGLGYPFAFIHESRILQALYAALPAGVRASCCHPDTRAVDVRHDEKGSTVITADMEMFRGDMVVDTSAPPTPSELPGAKGKNEGFTYVSGRTVLEDEPEGVHMSHEAGVAVTAVVDATGTCNWWALVRGVVAVEFRLSYQYGHMAVGGTTLGELWEEAEMVHMDVIGDDPGITPRWCESRSCLLGDAAYKISPLTHLGPTLDLESAVALANTLIHVPYAASESDISSLLSFFEISHRPRVELYTRLASTLSLIATHATPWHAFLAKHVIARTALRAWIHPYREFAIRSITLDEATALRGKFWDCKRDGGVVGWSRKTWANPRVRKGSVAAGASVALWMAGRWKVHAALAVGIAAAVVERGDKGRGVRLRPWVIRMQMEIEPWRMALMDWSREATMHAEKFFRPYIRKLDKYLSTRPNLRLGLAMSAGAGLWLLGGSVVNRAAAAVFLTASGGRQQRIGLIGVGAYCIPGTRHILLA